MDNSNLVLNLLQTIGVVGALLFAGYELLQRNREQKFRNYLDAISGFHRLGELMIENQDLHSLYDYSPEDCTKKYQELSPAQRALAHYCDLIISLTETVWVAQSKGWLAEDEWRYWETWVGQMRRSKDFRWTVQWVKDDYDPKFIKILEG